MNSSNGSTKKVAAEHLPEKDDDVVTIEFGDRILRSHLSVCPKPETSIRPLRICVYLGPIQRRRQRK